MTERDTCNVDVGGLIPSGGTIRRQAIMSEVKEDKNGIREYIYNGPNNIKAIVISPVPKDEKKPKRIDKIEIPRF